MAIFIPYLLEKYFKSNLDFVLDLVVAQKIQLFYYTTDRWIDVSPLAPTFLQSEKKEAALVGEFFSKESCGLLKFHGGRGGPIIISAIKTSVNLTDKEHIEDLLCRAEKIKKKLQNTQQLNQICDRYLTLQYTIKYLADAFNKANDDKMTANRLATMLHDDETLSYKKDPRRLSHATLRKDFKQILDGNYERYDI